MNSERTRSLLAIPLLGVVLGCLGWVEERVVPPRAGDRADGAARLLGASGELRPLLADAFWLRANLAWEREDAAATKAWAALAVAAEPEVPYFRYNAARMVAYDFPAWRIRREPHAPLAVVRHWRREAATEALAWLDGEPHPPTPARWIEAGNIALYGQEDPVAAATFYRRAAELPDAPWHAGRIAAELLWRSGQKTEAVRWLREWLPRLPEDEPAAQQGLVAARLAEFERSLSGTEPF